MQTATQHHHPLAQALALAIQAVANCQTSGNTEWQARHVERAEELVRNHLPSGSGLDSGVSLDWRRSTPERLVFTTSFHHMDGESGMYDGWTDHDVIVTASLAYRLDIRVSGRNRNDIKDYLAELFAEALSADVEG